MEIIIPLFICLGIFLSVWSFKRGRDILEHWAMEYGYQILSSHFCWLWRGPFFWRSSKGQMVYYVVVRTSDGYTRQGWVRCGSFFLGIWKDRAEVIWDE